jgi:hypothetical protein
MIPAMNLIIIPYFQAKNLEVIIDIYSSLHDGSIHKPHQPLL